MDSLIQGRLLVEQGSDFNLTCNSEGGPNNTHTWKLNGQLIENDSAFSISSESSDRNSLSILQVVNLDASTHKGIYMCIVENKAGNDSATFQVIGKLKYKLLNIVVIKYNNILSMLGSNSSNTIVMSFLFSFTKRLSCHKTRKCHCISERQYYILL